MMHALNEHLLAAQLSDFLLGKLTKPEAEAVETHLEQCQPCCERLYELSEELGEEGLIARLRNVLESSESRIGDSSVDRAVRTEAWSSARPATPPPNQPRTSAWTVPGYEILEELGRGGMSTVYRARDLRLKREVALKVLRSEVRAGDRQSQRFRTEAEIIARLQHPGIVQIHEVGEQDGQLYLVLELIEGGDLYRLTHHQPQPPHTAARWVETLARTTAYAHGHGIIHRDLKPSNVLVAPADEGQDAITASLKIADFGLAKQLDSGPDLTRPGLILGTPAYMAPEQTLGLAVGTAADIYALGAILYELLTGQPPFKVDSVLETLRCVREAEPLPPRRLQPGVPADLQTICLKCLEKDPTRRYASADALAEDLRRFQASEPIKARPVGTPERAWKWTKRRPALAALLVVVAIVLTTGVPALALLWRSAVEERENADRAREKAEATLYYSLIHQADLELRTFNVPQARRNLDSCVLQRRGWEWYYLDGLIHAEQMNLRQHKEAVNAVAFSPDGRYLVSGGGGLPVLPRSDTPGELFVWDLTPPVSPTSLGTQDLAVLSLAFGSTGRYLAVAVAEIYGASRREIRLWDVSTAAFVRRFEMPDSGRQMPAVIFNFRNVGLSPNDRRLAAFLGGDIHVWDVVSGRWTFTLRKQDNYAFSSDGGTLVTAGADGSITQWDATTGSKLRTLAQPGGERPSCTAFSADARLLAWVPKQNPDSILLRDAGTGNILRTLYGHAGEVMRVAFSPNGRCLASCGADGTVRLWDVATGRQRLLFLGHTDLVHDLAFSPDGTRLASAGWDSFVKVWDLTHPSGHVSLGATGKFAVDLAFTPDGEEFISAHQEGSGLLQRWDPATGKPGRRSPAQVHEDKEFRTPAHRLAFDPTCRQVVGPSRDDDRVLKVWDASTADEVRTLRGHTLPVQCVWFSADGRRLASLGYRRQNPDLPAAWECKVWDSATGQVVRELEDVGRAYALAIQPQGRLLAVAGSHPDVPWVKLWDIDTGQLLGEATDFRSEVMCLAFSPGGSELAAGDQRGTVILRRAATLALLWTNERPGSGYIYGLAFSPDGRRLASATRDVVKLWDAETGAEALTLRGPTRTADPRFTPCVVFSPDGRRLAATHWNKTITIWDATRHDR